MLVIKPLSELSEYSQLSSIQQLQRFSASRAASQPSLNARIKSGPIKPEPGTEMEGIETSPKCSNSATRTPADIHTAYASMFGAMHNLPLHFPIDDISQALTQAETLVDLTSAYACLHLVRLPISHALHTFHKRLYTAIRRDPPRWLLLAVALESQPLYIEAFIHIAGCWPTWRWKTPLDKLPVDVLANIKTKAKDLEG
ncbi:hypothetical protein LTS18_010887, partial [Coniosporium uncinatum]